MKYINLKILSISCILIIGNIIGGRITNGNEFMAINRDLLQ